MYYCPKCGRMTMSPGLCDSCNYMADGTGDIHLGKKICSVCHGSGRIIGIYGENEPCPYCNGEGITDTY